MVLLEVEILLGHRCNVVIVVSRVEWWCFVVVWRESCNKKAPHEHAGAPQATQANAAKVNRNMTFQMELTDPCRNRLCYIASALHVASKHKTLSCCRRLLPPRDIQPRMSDQPSPAKRRRMRQPPKPSARASLSTPPGPLPTTSGPSKTPVPDLTRTSRSPVTLDKLPDGITVDRTNRNLLRWEKQLQAGLCLRDQEPVAQVPRITDTDVPDAPSSLQPSTPGAPETNATEQLTGDEDATAALSVWNWEDAPIHQGRDCVVVHVSKSTARRKAKHEDPFAIKIRQVSLVNFRSGQRSSGKPYIRGLRQRLEVPAS